MSETLRPPPVRKRIVVGITGATGSIFGIRMLERLREFDVETHLVVSPWGGRTLEHETPYTIDEVRGLADVVYKPNDQGAAISSGSFQTHGMIIAPCSVKTLAGIAAGYAQDLVARAADVVLKENRRLVLLVRESPLSAIHLENMLKLAQLGVRLVPPVPAFYNQPKSLEDVVDHIVTRALDQFDMHSDQTPRWDGLMTPKSGSHPDA
jgi:flavin prenyltransferase